MKKRILIVDDEPPIRKLFARTIGTENYAIRAAASGVEALALLKNDPADLVLLDLNMPELDGADTLAEIRKIDQAVPVFIITSFKDAFFDKLKILRDAGIQFEVINKPVEKEHLRELVESVLYGPGDQAAGGEQCK